MDKKKLVAIVGAISAFVVALCPLALKCFETIISVWSVKGV